MKKGILLVMLVLLSFMIVACGEIGRYSVNPRDYATNTFDLLFDEIGQTFLIRKEISIDISDDSNYTGNHVGPAGIVTMEYTLRNTTDEPVYFHMIWVYPRYDSSDFKNLYESLMLEIDDAELERDYYEISYEQHPENDDFTYSNVWPLVGEKYANIEDIDWSSTRKNLCSYSTHKINPQSDMKVKIMLPTWPKGHRVNPAPDLEYLITLDNLHFDDVETIIIVSGNRAFKSTNHTKDNHHILIDKDSGNTIYVRAVYKSPHYSSWTPYCSYKG